MDQRNIHGKLEPVDCPQKIADFVKRGFETVPTLKLKGRTRKFISVKREKKSPKNAISLKIRGVWKVTKKT